MWRSRGIHELETRRRNFTRVMRRSRDLFLRRHHIVDAFFSALTISTITTPGTSMRQSFTASFIRNCVPAAAVGLMLMPPVTAAAATPEPNSAEQVEAAPPDVTVVDPHENG